MILFVLHSKFHRVKGHPGFDRSLICPNNAAVQTEAAGADLPHASVASRLLL